MDKPNRHQNHILSTKSAKYLESVIPDEWYYNVPTNDYGIDYQVEIVLNGQVSGLNFSIQLKSTEQTEQGDFAKVQLKRSTLNYYKVRLEPIMLVVYDANAKDAYWSWISDHQIDFSKLNKSFTLSVPKAQKLGGLNWSEIVNHVQGIFNAKSFISDFDILKIDNDIELAAWKTYYEEDFEQATYLFRRLIGEGKAQYGMYQALAWSLYQTFRYDEALNVINMVLEIKETENALKSKACILAEAGFRDRDKGRIIQAKNLFKKFSNGEDSSVMLYNYANTLNELGEFREAIEKYKLSIEKEPNNAECWKNLGTTYYNINDHEKEIACYNKALSINPNLQPALFSKGVTLAQHFKKYEEALQLFHKVLDDKNNLAFQYINGLFWVAFCYEQIGNLEKALFWIDKGLNYDGSNLYFLNFKSNLLANNWRNHAKFKDQAIEFFEYRIELENDSRSLYHLIIIKELNLENALEFVKSKVFLYEKISLADLTLISFSMDDLLTTLLHLEYYRQFREKYPTSRYLDHLISPHFSIGADFFNLSELIFGLAFNKAIVRYSESNEDLAVPRTISETMLVFMPMLISFLVNKYDYERTAIGAIIFEGIQGYTNMIFREIGAQSGHITVNLGLRNIDPSEYLIEDYSDRLGEKVYNSFIKHLL